MRKLISFMHVSLDGYVAGPNGELNWAHVDEEIFDYVGSMIDSSDLAVYGRNTYAMMESYWPTAADQPDASRHDIEHSKWYKQVSKLVVSTTLSKNIPNTQVIASNLAEEVNKIKKQQGGPMLIFGSPGATHSLLELDLIDDFWLFLNPILLGNGTPMFSKIEGMRNLKLRESLTFKSGVIKLHYERIRDKK